MARQHPPQHGRILNKKAAHNFHVIERMEAGIALTGTEVKSLRNGQASLEQAFARVVDDQIVLYGCHISPYEHAQYDSHDPTRPRKLLLHRREIRRLLPKVLQRGQTLVPLSIYFSRRGLAKVDLALVRGKSQYDKRQELRAREHKREIAREVAHSRRRSGPRDAG